MSSQRLTARVEEPKKLCCVSSLGSFAEVLESVKVDQSKLFFHGEPKYLFVQPSSGNGRATCFQDSQCNIFYVKPWTRFRKDFLSPESFAESVRAVCEEHPDKRYFGCYQFLQPTLFVKDVDLVKEMTVKDFDHFTDHSAFTSEENDPVLGLNLFCLRGQKWREMRTTLSPAFTGNKMRLMFTLMLDTAQNFSRYFLQKSDEVIVVDMREVFGKYTNDIIANCGFGIKCNSLEEQNNELYAMGKYIVTPTPSRIMRTFLYGFFTKIFEFFQISSFPTHVMDFFERIIKDTVRLRETRGIMRPDLIHLLLEARKGRLKHEKSDSGDDAGFATVQESDLFKNQNHAFAEITDEVITAQVVVFFVAAITSASATMSFMAYELAIAPDIQKKLQDEIDLVLANNQGKISYEVVLKMKYLDQVISETLRKYPPGYILNRLCVKDYVIKPKNDQEQPVVIKKDCLVGIVAIAMHYNPEYFPDPEKFDPDRFNDENKAKIVPGSYVPFGMGPRNCIGSRFALLKMKVLMASLLSQFDIVTVEKTVIPLKLAKTVSLDAKGGVWLGLRRRKESLL